MQPIKRYAFIDASWV